MEVLFRLLVVIMIFLPSIHGTPLQCYTGFKLFGGQGVGDQTKTCESEGDFCYNMTASSGMLLNVAKAGCSTYRCLFSRDSCQKTEFQGIPVSFCCCSEDLCNGRQ